MDRSGLEYPGFISIPHASHLFNIVGIAVFSSDIPIFALPGITFSYFYTFLPEPSSPLAPHPHL